MPHLPEARVVDGDCPEPVELILYVDAKSARSKAAIEEIRAGLARLRAPRVRLTIRELPRDRSRIELEPGTAEPRRATRGPRTFIIGHLTSQDLVLKLVAECGAA
jgi:hypothetical protein